MDEFPNIVILKTRPAFLILQQCLERQLWWILHTVLLSWAHQMFEIELEHW